MKSIQAIGIALVVCVLVNTNLFANNDNEKPKIQFIENTGIMITYQDKSVLIDALFRLSDKPNSVYGSLPNEMQRKIEYAKPPFDSIDVILATHNHYDHFSAIAVVNHLKSNSKTVFIGRYSMVKAIKNIVGNSETILNRIKEISPRIRERVNINIRGIDISLCGLKHSYHRMVNNVVYLKLGGKTFLHTGDVDILDRVFGVFLLNKEGVDVAFINDWAIVGVSEEKLNFTEPKKIFAVHSVPARREKILNQIKKYKFNVTLMTDMLKVYKY